MGLRATQTQLEKKISELSDRFKKIPSLKERDKMIENKDEGVRDIGNEEGIIDMQLQSQDRKKRTMQKKSQKFLKLKKRHQAQIKYLIWINPTQDE